MPRFSVAWLGDASVSWSQASLLANPGTATKITASRGEFAPFSYVVQLSNLGRAGWLWPVSVPGALTLLDNEDFPAFPFEIADCEIERRPNKVAKAVATDLSDRDLMAPFGQALTSRSGIEQDARNDNSLKTNDVVRLRRKQASRVSIAWVPNYLFGRNLAK
jgi:hypothetical protein